jgi:hypothetical protein
MSGTGPTPMALGSYAFYALGFAFEGQSRGLETPWAEIDVTSRFDSLQWVGPKGETFAIKGVIFEPEFGGQDSLDGLRDAAANGRPLMLVTRAGKVHGQHVIVSINEDRDAIHASGVARRNSYTIELKKKH